MSTKLRATPHRPVVTVPDATVVEPEPSLNPSTFVPVDDRDAPEVVGVTPPCEDEGNLHTEFGGDLAMVGEKVLALSLTRVGVRRLGAFEHDRPKNPVTVLDDSWGFVAEWEHDRIHWSSFLSLVLSPFQEHCWIGFISYLVVL